MAVSGKNILEGVYIVIWTTYCGISAVNHTKRVQFVFSTTLKVRLLWKLNGTNIESVQSLIIFFCLYYKRIEKSGCQPSWRKAITTVLSFVLDMNAELFLLT